MPITGTEGCKTPNEIWDSELERQLMENRIEQVITAHFRTSPAARGAIDIFVDPGIAGPRMITDWISRNSFGRVINKRQMLEGFDSGYYSVPDIVTSRGLTAQSEYYEIKPNSGNGLREGRDKIRCFQQLNEDFRLMFFSGTDYDPKGSQIFCNGVFGLYEYELTLKWWRHLPGLIVYEVCYRVLWRVEPLPYAVLLALLALLLFVLLRGAGSLKSQPGFIPKPVIA